MVSRAIIEQQRREFGYGTAPSAPTTGPVLVMDLSAGLVQSFMLNINCFIAEPINPPNVGDRLILILQQDGGSGNFSVTWGVCFRDPPSWSGAAKGTRATAQFVYDGFTYQYMGGSSAFAVSGLSLVPNTGTVALASDPSASLVNPAPTVGGISLAGVSPTVTNRTIVSLAPAIGALTAAGVAPLVSTILTPPVAALIVQGQIPTRAP